MLQRVRKRIQMTEMMMWLAATNPGLYEALRYGINVVTGS
jgi:hypothetical protein